MRVIAIVNQKGGCGKTTTTVNLGGCLAAEGARVLVVDMDPQAHATLALGVDPDEVEENLYEVLAEPGGADHLGRDILEVQDNLYVAPSGIVLSALEQRLATERVETRTERLSTAISRLPEPYDYILIDCAPNVGLLTFNALRAAGEVIVPLETSPFAIHGVQKLLETIALLSERVGHEVTVRILQKPQTVRGMLFGFPTLDDGGNCVADIIAAGIIPGGLEMMDNMAIIAADDFQPCGYPRDVESLLICELDGTDSEVDHLIARVSDIAKHNNATVIRVAETEAERLQFWAGRKNAFPAVGAIGPDYLCMDGTIPRKELSNVLAGMRELSKKHGLRVANVFHAGDGNLHPLILYDASIDGDIERAEAFGADILRLCVEVGGCLTGEHGVGIEKRDLMNDQYDPGDLEIQMAVKDVFDPKWLLNPAKVFPLAASDTRRIAAE